MPDTTSKSEAQQGPWEGSRCVAGPGGRWGPATIHRVNEDGTFTVEFDVKEMLIMPYWYGVTSSEISFDDAHQWASVFAELSPDGKRFTPTDFFNALTRLGYRVDEEQARQFWRHSCQKLFSVPADQAETRALDREESHQLLLDLGASAKQWAENLKKDRPQSFFKLYWNQTRMGGRDPADVRRPVTLADAFAALGVVPGRVDRSTATFLQGFEQMHNLVLPAALKELVCQKGIADTVADCHPNNPSLQPFRDWLLRPGMRGQQLQGDCAIVIMDPHQGDHQWAAVFDDGDDDARVYVRWDAEEGEDWLLTAPGVGMFFWDLAQTGLAWFQETQFDGGKPATQGDIGLILGS
jgi:hypothetical protein